MEAGEGQELRCRSSDASAVTGTFQSFDCIHSKNSQRKEWRNGELTYSLPLRDENKILNNMVQKGNDEHYLFNKQYLFFLESSDYLSMLTRTEILQ